MQNPKNTQNLEDTFNQALNAAFERKAASDEVLSALAGMGDDEIEEMRETVAAAQHRLKSLQGMAKPTTKRQSK